MIRQLRLENPRFLLASALAALLAMPIASASPNDKPTHAKPASAKPTAAASAPAPGTGPSSASAVKDDDLNGLWTCTLGGKSVAGGAQTESWAEIGFRLRLNGQVTHFTRNGDTLVAAAPTPGFADVINAGRAPASSTTKLTITSIDELDGTYAGQPIVLKRDTSVKPPIVLKLPADRPWMLFATQLLDPAANRDRESYELLNTAPVQSWLSKCELYDYWQKKYMKGGAAGSKTSTPDQQKAFAAILAAIDGLHTTPRDIIREPKFSNAVTANLADPTTAGLALSNFSLYFACAGGRSVRIPVTSDSLVYFMTDRPSRAGKIGVCAMETPTHKPLASTFGRLLLDCGKMPASDDAIFWRSMLEVLAKSDSSSAQKLSPLGRSVMCDYVGVMAIEHYRDIAFQDPQEHWGYNMTSVMFCARVVRALKSVIELNGSTSTLNPGEPSYFDVLNGGVDMQEIGGMATIKQMTTAWLKQAHPDIVARVQKSLAGVVPAGELTDLAKQDIFHFLCQNFYDARIASIQGKQADEVVAAASALMDTIGSESDALRAYILAHGVTANSTPAPQTQRQ